MEFFIFNNKKNAFFKADLLFNKFKSYALTFYIEADSVSSYLNYRVYLHLERDQ